MDAPTNLVTAFMVVLARVSGFIAVLPVFSSSSAPVPLRIGIALAVSLVLASVIPPAPALVGAGWVAVSLVVVQEILIGAGLALAVALVFAAVSQAGLVIHQQMGMSLAEIIDPMTGEESDPLGMILESCFTVLLLVAGGHQWMLRLMARSYEAFPVGGWPSAGALAEMIVEAGTLMLTFALQLAAPLLAAFLVLAVVLAVLSRILPEMNILFESLPLRVGLGLFMTAALLPLLNGFTALLGQWLSEFLVT
jgi:flagellar biosynthetic protein FliR